MADHYVAVKQGVELLDDIEEQLRAGGRSTEDADSLRAEGQWLSDYLADDIHKQTKRSTHPNMLQVLPRLRDWEARMNELAGMIIGGGSG